MNENVKLLSQDPAAIDMLSVLADPKVIKIYGNGFTFGYSLSDAMIVVQHGPVPVAMISLSLTSLKSLSIGLVETIIQIERDLKEPVKSMQEIKAGLS